MKKWPPKEKILEAWTAIADGHVELENNEAYVISSNGEKTYTVVIDGNTYRSDDSATFWQGYAGYPVIAVLMKEGRLPYHKEIGEQFKGVDWHAVNDQYKRDYPKAAAAVMEQRHIDPVRTYDEANTVFSRLQTLPIEVKRLVKRKK